MAAARGPAPEEARGGEEVEVEAEVEVDVVESNGKRTTRKITQWIFAERHEDGKHVYCKLGCLSDDGLSKKAYVAHTTSHVIRHCATHHKDLQDAFVRCCNTKAGINELLDSVNATDLDTSEKLRKRRKKSDSIWGKAVKMPNAVASDLHLLLWAVKNGISRNALNDKLFDSYVRSLGAITPANRHDLQAQHLPLLDELVRDTMVAALKDVQCISLSSDGWKDRARRDWINLVIVWISETPGLWQINCIEPDLIHVPVSATSATISYLIDESLSHIVPPSYFLFVMNFRPHMNF